MSFEMRARLFLNRNPAESKTAKVAERQLTTASRIWFTLIVSAVSFADRQGMKKVQGGAASPVESNSPIRECKQSCLKYFSPAGDKPQQQLLREASRVEVGDKLSVFHH